MGLNLGNNTEHQRGGIVATVSLGMVTKRQSVMLSAMVTLMILLCLLVLSPLQAHAQEGLGVAVEGSGSMSLPASVNGGSGKYAVVRAGGTATMKTPYVTLGLSARKDIYSWFDKHDLPFGNGQNLPWEALNRVGLSLRHTGEFGGQWGYFASTGASLSYEKEVDGSLGLSASAGGVWRPNDEWSVRLGAGVVWHRIRSYPVPVVGVSYRSATVKGFEADLGFPYSHARYRLNDLVGLRLTGEFDYGLYRLASDSDVSRKGYVEMAGYSTGLWFDLYPLEGLQLSAGGGWDFQGSVSTYRESGEGKKTYSRAGTPRMGVTAKYTF